MRFSYILVVALLVAWAAFKILFGGAVQTVSGAGSGGDNRPLQATASPDGWTIADTRQLFEANHYPCGFVANEEFDFDEVTETKTGSTRGTIFADAADIVITPTARRRSRHEAVDYLWCDLGNVNVAGVSIQPGDRVYTRNIFVSKNGLVAEYLILLSHRAAAADAAIQLMVEIHAQTRSWHGSRRERRPHGQICGICR